MRAVKRTLVVVCIGALSLALGYGHVLITKKVWAPVAPCLENER